MTLPAVGFIGLGQMGRGMARNLAGAVEALYVHDARAEARADLVAAGATECADPAAVAARASLVFLCLPFAPEVRDAVFGAGGLAEARAPALTVIDTTTLDRIDALAIADEAAAAGIAYCDCPISGTPIRAADGTLTIMFGGGDAAFVRAEPYLRAIGQTIIRCGAVGSGQAMKALNNVIYDINIAAICELLPLAAKVGLDPRQVAEVVTTGTSRSFASEHFVPRILDGLFEGDFPLEGAYKDIVNVQRMAVEHKAMTPVANAMVATYQAALAQGLGAEPKSAMIKLYEAALGVQFRRPAAVPESD